MSNRTEMVTRVRLELGDDTVPYIWSDSLLEKLIIEAAEWYSRLFPVQGIMYVDVAADQRTFDISGSGSVLKVVGVELPPGNPIPADPSVPVGDPDEWDGGTYKQAYSVWNDTLYLRNAASGDEVGAANLAVRFHTFWDRPDPIMQWGGPVEDEQLLIYQATLNAWDWHAGLMQRLNRRNAALDNAQRYRQKVEDHIKTKRRAFSSRTVEVA